MGKAQKIAKNILTGKKGNTKVNVFERLDDVTTFQEYKLLPINRVIREQHVKRLMVSFKEFGASARTIIGIRTNAFSKDGSYEVYIADGQHGAIAATRLGLGLDMKIVQLVEDNKMNVTKLVAALNNTSKGWSTNNFLSTFIENDIYEYKRFGKIMTDNGLTITDLLHIFCGEAGVKENKAFKLGELSFIDENDSNHLLEATVKVMPYIPNKAFIRRKLYKVMRTAKNYNKMAEAIVKAGKVFQATGQSFPENEDEFYNSMVKVMTAVFPDIKPSKPTRKKRNKATA